MGVTTPKDILDSLHLAEADPIYASVNGDAVHLTAYDPDFDAAMEAFGRTRRNCRNALRKLATPHICIPQVQ